MVGTRRTSACRPFLILFFHLGESVSGLWNSELRSSSSLRQISDVQSHMFASTCQSLGAILFPKKDFMFAFLRLFWGQWIEHDILPFPLGASSADADCILWEESMARQHKENDCWETNFLPDLASLCPNEEGMGEEKVFVGLSLFSRLCSQKPAL